MPLHLRLLMYTVCASTPVLIQYKETGHYLSKNDYWRTRKTTVNYYLMAEENWVDRIKVKRRNVQNNIQFHPATRCSIEFDSQSKWIGACTTTQMVALVMEGWCHSYMYNPVCWSTDNWWLWQTAISSINHWWNDWQETKYGTSCCL
jgi:hypothetical protein